MKIPMKVLNMDRDTVTGKDYLPDAPDADASPPDAPTLDGITKTTTRWIKLLDIGYNFTELDSNLDHWT